MQIGVFNTAQRNDGSCSRYGSYIHEILGHAGFPYTTIPSNALAEALPNLAILVLPTHLNLNPEQKQLITHFVESGHMLIACGGPSGLDELLGCRDLGPIDEAWIEASGTNHPVTGSLTFPLHAFGGHLVQAVGDSVVLAQWLDGSRYEEGAGWQKAAMGAAITLRKYGAGYALLMAPDLVYSIVRIQQGLPVHVDARPAADGTAPVNDGVLKTDDGLVLDYVRDRVPIADTRFFGHGIADVWRELLLSSLLWGATVTGVSFPVLWYWPEHQQAVGLISHDSDGNDPALADVLLTNLQKLQIPSTWCVQYPGGYAPAFYQKLKSLGYEVAQHFDAYTQRGRAFWNEEDFKVQVNWLTDMSGGAVISNKNHYLRWEGLDEFFVWMERAGVKADQSKGPSKTGNTGFPFGGCHPWFPVHEHTMRPIDVLEINLSTQDLSLTCPVDIGPASVDWVVSHYGVAHFLFHPAHAAKPDVAAAMVKVVEYGRQKGLQWWTCNKIQQWERTRRQVQMAVEQKDGKSVWTMSSRAAVPGATVLWFGAGAPAIAGGRDSRQVNVYGFTATAQVVDVEADQKMILA